MSALAALAILGGLTACGTADAESGTAAAVTSSAISAADPTTAAAADAAVSGTDTYTDGSYSASGSYHTPGGQESIEVLVTITDDVVTAVTVTGSANDANSSQYQAKFAGGISAVVVGQNIDDISVSKVAGSSLTGAGFNEALTQIKTEAVAT